MMIQSVTASILVARAGCPGRARESKQIMAQGLSLGHGFARECAAMATVLCVLYDDPVDGYPPSYARDGIPKIERYYDGSTTPTPERIDFTPGELLGSVSGGLGLRTFLEERGHRFVVTSDKEGPDSEFDRELPDADVVISQPFWPAYLTAERIAKAPKLKLAVTAGIGSDHVDLPAAIEHGITVAEVSYSNSISVSEHVVMMILALVRNYIPSYKVVVDGGWNIADCASRSYDLEGMQVGTVGAGRIGSAVLRRLQPFEVGLHYTDKHRLPTEEEERLGVTFHESAESLVQACDVVTINAPLHPETEHLFDDALIGKMKRGAYLVNTARGKICDRDAVVRALESGQLAGYAGDVWFPQPAPRTIPWRTMPHHGMTPHTSGTSLSAQARYAAGTREILECWFDGRPIREEYLIVDAGSSPARALTRTPLSSLHAARNKPLALEIVLVWSLWLVVAVEILVTYWRLPAHELYRVSGSGLTGATSRVLVESNYPIALVAIGIVILLYEKLSSRGARAAAVVGVVSVRTVRGPASSRGRSRREVDQRARRGRRIDRDRVDRGRGAQRREVERPAAR